jgi:hypothetical protein
VVLRVVEDDEKGTRRCHWWTQIQDLSPPGWGLDARLMTLLCMQIIVTKSKKVKTGCNLAESSMEGCGSKRDNLPMMVMMMIWKAF